MAILLSGHQTESDQRTADERELMDLKASYIALTTDRYPVKDDITTALSPESAFQLYLEQEYMAVPKDLHFDHLKGDIHPDHLNRIEAAWSNVTKFEELFETTVQALLEHWNNAPNTKDQLANQAIQEARLRIEERFKKAAIAIISRPNIEQSRILWPENRKKKLRTWQATERIIREALHKNGRDYLRALRVYYGLLIESPPNRYDGESNLPLPEDHSSRWDIALRMRVLEYIDAAHQADTVAKTIHHAQKGHRTRRIGGAYLQHPIRTRQSLALHSLPFILDQPFESGKTPNYLAEAMGGSLHDTDEDGRLSANEVVGKMEDMGNRIDSVIDQQIATGFPTTLDIREGDQGRGRLKRKLLALVKSHTRHCLRSILMGVTKGSERNFTDTQKKKAVQQNILGRRRTFELLGIDEKDLPKWQIDPKEGPVHPNSATVRRFPQSESEKPDRFLLKLGLIKDPNEAHSTLKVKMEDQFDNLRSLRVHKPLTQRKKLRYTVTRIIAWPILETEEETGFYDLNEFPLHNTLPFLIRAAIREYKRFYNEHPELMTEYDVTLFGQLHEWEKTFQVLEIQGKARAAMDKWYAAHPDYVETE